MHYYEIEFYERDSFNNWCFYVKTKDSLTNAEVLTLLKKDFIGVDGLSLSHIENTTSIIEISSYDFEISTGLTP